MERLGRNDIFIQTLFSLIVGPSSFYGILCVPSAGVNHWVVPSEFLKRHDEWKFGGFHELAVGTKFGTTVSAHFI